MGKNLVDLPNIVSFRQTLNLWSKNWLVPKRLVDGKWVPVNQENLKRIVTKNDGYKFALWRMHRVMESIRDEHGRPVWKVNKISKEKVVWKNVRYSVFRFDCHRIMHGIIGGMNTRA